MARVLAYTSPARGHLYPITPILSELRNRGHEVHVRTLASEVESMRGLGFKAAAITPAIEAIEMSDWQAANPRDALERGVMTFAERAPLDAADFKVSIEQVRPDALLVDINSWGALAAAERSELPWAAFCPYPIPLQSRDVPPFGPGLPPARGPFGRLRDRLLRPIVFGTVEKKMLPPYNETRVALGLSPIESANDIFRGPPLMIYMTAEPFEYHRSDWPESFTMVGPCEWEPPAELPEWVASIDRPIVLVTTSSEFQDDGVLARAALEALADEDLDVIVTVPAGDPDSFDVPPNARVVKYLPHGPVLDRAACAVTHGGMGATQKALSRGVPVCVVPFGRDQMEVARRVENADAGTRLPSGKLSAARLRDHVREAMAMREGAQRIAQSFADAGGPVAAADAFESRLIA